MNIIQDKLGNEFLRSNGGMDSGFGSGMLMFSHLPPVTSFTRLAAQTVMQDLPPQEIIFKKERDSPGCGGGDARGGGGLVCGQVGDYVHTMGIKQEKLTEHDYRLPLYPGGSGRSTELLEVSMGNHHQSLLVQDLSMANQLPSRLGKEATARKGRRSNGDGQEGKPRKRRSEAKQSMMLDADGGSMSPGTKPHICEHCSASFRSSYHLRRHVLIHTGERPFRCSQCNMSFIQKYLLQRHEKIHSGEKPFSCDQCNMRFIQKYHMERHKRTHSGEKPYRCETCQQYFSRTDRLLKHKRTCGDGMRKDSDMLDLGCGHMDQGYGVSQVSTAPAGRKKGRPKNNGEGGKRKKGAGSALGSAQVHDGYGVQHYSVENHSMSSCMAPGPSASQQNHQSHLGGAPKGALKKANRKAQDQAQQAHLEPSAAMDGFTMMQSNGAKTSATSSNYDDAMQFLKKRRYLNAANNAPPPPPPGGVSAGGTGNEYDVGVGHLAPQQSVIQGTVSGSVDGDAALLDSSHIGLDKLDRSGIPDEVLQSLLDHYTQKPDGSPHDLHFDLGDHHVGLHPSSADGADLSHHSVHDVPGPAGDKAALMHEYSRFLLQALERTSFHLSPGPPPSGPFATSHPGNPLYADKNIYTTSPLECGFGPSAGSPSMPTSSSPSSTSSSSVPKSHFAMLAGSSPPQHGFQLSGPESSTHQQLTPSQELTEQTDKQHSSSSSSASPPPPPSSYQISPSDLSSHKQPQSAKSAAAAAAYRLSASQDLESKSSSYHMENFAQAFGSQFKSDGCGMSYGGDSGTEVDHRIRTPVSEFSGYSSLLSDVNEPVSTASKTPTSQSYR